MSARWNLTATATDVDVGSGLSLARARINAEPGVLILSSGVSSSATTEADRPNDGVVALERVSGSRRE